jgi:hypothetical protein
MALDQLKVAKAPKALASTARMHNQLCELIGRMRGTAGIRVQATDGGIVISLDPTSATGTGLGGSGVAGTQTLNVIGTDGLLYEAYVNSNTTNFGYPNMLRVGPNASQFWQANATGMFMQGSTNTARIDFANITKDMSLRTMQVCDNGNVKTILIFASAPY